MALDQRAIAPRERHASAFSRFAALLPGQALQLLNDHDPQPLRTQFVRRCLAISHGLRCKPGRRVAHATLADRRHARPFNGRFLLRRECLLR
jgi:Uncharacterized conserved protein (DUF2249)